jgi:hypothetical protein
MQKILVVLKKFLKKLNPIPPVGALSLGDSVVRFLLIDEAGKLIASSFKLPPHTITKGSIENRAVFLHALREFRLTLNTSKTPLHVVLVLPPGLVYVQPFSLPALPPDRLSEAAALNLQMISPLDFSLSYAAYEKIGDRTGEGGGTDMLGAFVERESVRQFSDVLTEAGFAVTAVEFPSLGLARAARSDKALAPDRAYVIIDVGADGLSLIIFRNLRPYFSHFQGWQEVQEAVGGKIDKENFTVFLEREIQKLLNFYSTRWGGSLSEIVIAAGPEDSGFETALSSAMKLPVRQLAIAEFPLAGSAWFSVLGSALRGTLPRTEDISISLTDAPVQVQYREARIINFVRWWRKVALTVTAFIMLLFIGADSFLARANVAMDAAIQTGVERQEFDEVRTLEKKAQEFNSLVNLLIAAQPKNMRWQEVMGSIVSMAGTPIVLKRFAWSGESATLAGVAGDVDALIAFKRKLIDSGIFREVVLPITTVIGNPDETLNFNATLTLKK